MHIEKKGTADEAAGDWHWWLCIVPDRRNEKKNHQKLYAKGDALVLLSSASVRWYRHNAILQHCACKLRETFIGNLCLPWQLTISSRKQTIEHINMYTECRECRECSLIRLILTLPIRYIQILYVRCFHCTSWAVVQTRGIKLETANETWYYQTGPRKQFNVSIYMTNFIYGRQRSCNTISNDRPKPILHD